MPKNLTTTRHIPFSLSVSLSLFLSLSLDGYSNRVIAKGTIFRTKFNLGSDPDSTFWLLRNLKALTETCISCSPFDIYNTFASLKYPNLNSNLHLQTLSSPSSALSVIE
jgi:hypothetical protein